MTLNRFFNENATIDEMVDETIGNLCASIGLPPPASDEVLLSEHGLPSLQIATLAVTLEERTGLEFTDEELALTYWLSPAQIKAMLERRISSVS